MIFCAPFHGCHAALQGFTADLRRAQRSWLACVHVQNTDLHELQHQGHEGLASTPGLTGRVGGVGVHQAEPNCAGMPMTSLALADHVSHFLDPFV